MLRIIDNKKIDLTDSEFALYNEICKSYDRNNFSGKDLFKGLFETNEKGIIIFLRPPTGKYTSMEIYMFLVNVMVHQHLGAACSHVDDLIKDAKLTINEAKKIIDEMKLLKKSNQS